MILRNTGKSSISYADRGAHGVALPNTNFQVSDPMGAYLKKLYPHQIENLEDAVKKFQDAKDTAPAVAKVVVAKKSAYQIMLEEQAKADEPAKETKAPAAASSPPAKSTAEQAKADEEALEKLTRPSTGGASTTRK